MNILIIGPVSFPGGLVGSYYRAFRNIKGIKICSFDTDIESYIKIPRNWILRDQMIDRIKIKIFTYINNIVLKQKLKKNIFKDSYKNTDIIFVFKSPWIDPTLLLKMKETTGALVFHFNPDSPFDNNNYHPNLIKSIPFYDCHFTWNPSLIRKIYEFGGKRVKYLPFAWDPDLHQPFSIRDDEIYKYRSDISFTGTWTSGRERWLESLLDYNLSIWGDNGWKRSNSQVLNKWKGRAVRGKEFVKLCQASKINLNFLRKQNKDSHNMRTFEVPGCKGFLMTERSQEQTEFFSEGKEAEYFEDINELREKIDYYLDHPKERKKIAEAAHKKVQKHTYYERAKQILRVYEELS